MAETPTQKADKAPAPASAESLYDILLKYTINAMKNRGEGVSHAFRNRLKRDSKKMRQER